MGCFGLVWFVCFPLFFLFEFIFYFILFVQWQNFFFYHMLPGQDQYICPTILNMSCDIPQKPVMLQEQKYVDLCFHSHGVWYSKTLESKRLQGSFQLLLSSIFAQGVEFFLFVQWQNFFFQCKLPGQEQYICITTLNMP